MACTEFCRSLQSISYTDGRLPTHDDLFHNLPPDIIDPNKGCYLGTWQEVQRWSRCTFCHLVVAAVKESSSTYKLQDIEISPEQPLSVVLFPSEQSFRLSFPSFLGLRLCFVGSDGESATGRDTARRLEPRGVPLPLVEQWLRQCDENHEDCVLYSTHDNKPDENKSRHLRSRKFNESATSNFRLINLERGCIEKAPLHSKYVALSYVWGNLTTFRLHTEVYTKMSEDESLDSIRAMLPKTVNDAIDFVKELGIRYLWVDMLCLVQDDEDDVALGVRMMNSIYSGSYFTLVAGDGFDADAGLSGYGKSTDESRVSGEIFDLTSGLQMTYVNSVDWHFDRAFYNKRGWTLQELVLPRRTVIFINNQVFFRCQEANWSEALWSDKWTSSLDSDDSNISRLPDPADGFLPSCWAYQKLTEEYSRRTLSHSGDTLQAIAGICRPLAAGMATLLVEGLPGYYLDHFCLFISSRANLQRQQQFGSFSWAGWDGPIMYPRENYTWFDEDGCRTWGVANILKHFHHHRILEWHELNTKGHIENLSGSSWGEVSRLLQVTRQYPSIFSDPDIDPERQRGGHQFSTVSGIHGDVPRWGPRPNMLDESTVSPGAEEVKLKPNTGFSLKILDLVNGEVEFAKRIQGLKTTPQRMALMNWMAVRSSRIRRANGTKSPIGPRLPRGDTSHLHFRSQNVLDEKKEGENDLRALNAGEWLERQKKQGSDPKAGQMLIPNFPPYAVLQFNAISLHLTLGSAPTVALKIYSHFDRIPAIPLLSSQNSVVGSLHPDNLNILGPAGSSIELIIIARCNTPTTASALPGVTADGALDRPWALFWALHIVWKSGIAERRGVCQIFQSALESAVEPKPEVKLILLG